MDNKITNIDHRLYSGFLFDSSFEKLLVSTLEFGIHSKIEGQLLNTQWEKFNYRSEVPLIDDEIVNSTKTIWNYPLVCRRSGSKVIILSYNRDIVKAYRNKLNEEKTVNLKFVNILVDDFVRNIFLFNFDEDRVLEKFAISYLNAEYNQSGDHLIGLPGWEQLISNMYKISKKKPH